jgi:hypothetical protein
MEKVTKQQYVQRKRAEIAHVQAKIIENFSTLKASEIAELATVIKQKKRDISRTVYAPQDEYFI